VPGAPGVPSSGCVPRMLLYAHMLCHGISFVYDRLCVAWVWGLLHVTCLARQSRDLSGHVFCAAMVLEESVRTDENMEYSVEDVLG
jgi:hypothetical protein